MKIGSDLISIFRVSLEECLDLELVHSATQAPSESSLEPKVQIADAPSQELQEFRANVN